MPGTILGLSGCELTVHGISLKQLTVKGRARKEHAGWECSRSGGGAHLTQPGLGWDAGRRADWICICTKAGTFKGRWGGSVG